MPVPDPGLEKTLGKIRQELQSLGELSDYDDGPYTSGETTLEQANTYQYGPGFNAQNLEDTSTNYGGNLVVPHGMDEQSSYDQNAGFEGDNGKIICATIYNSTGLIDWKENSILWNKHLDKYLTKYHQVGYHALFYKFTKLMNKNKYIFKLGKYMAIQRTEDINRIKKNKPRHIKGMIIRYVFEPICFIYGYISLKIKN